MTARRFAKFAVIDWSGQNVARPKGLAVAVADAGKRAPAIVIPPARHWSRQAILEWLRDRAGDDMLIGLDLSPALPHADRGCYFPEWSDGPADAKSLWQTVDTLSSSDPHLAVNSFLAHEQARRHYRHRKEDVGDLFSAGAGRMRVCEIGQRAMGLSPSSCMNLIGASQVGKSSLTGMRVLHRLSDAIPVWPFDPVPESGALIVEIYTTIAARAAGLRAGLSKMRSWGALDAALVHHDIASLPSNAHGSVDEHMTDAILTVAWLRAQACRQELWHPAAMTPEIARTEGWTFGVA